MGLAGAAVAVERVPVPAVAPQTVLSQVGAPQRSALVHQVTVGAAPKTAQVVVPTRVWEAVVIPFQIDAVPFAWLVASAAVAAQYG